MAPHPDVHSDPQAPSLVHFAKRDDGYQVNPAAGAKPANEFDNKWFQALFAIIGTGMVLTALWFFFWAKNGGFKWRGKDDWEDYKSTVLRRKGPDGKTLSNATKSTKLGGGSVVHGGSFGAESSVGYTDETGTSADFSEMREAEEGVATRDFGLRGGEGKSKKHRRSHTNNHKDPELREYRQERSARVGGINRHADGLYTDYSAAEPSELGSNVSGKPLVPKDAPKDQKKEAKAKERRAKERMKKAKAAEKEAAKNAAAEAKAKKEAEKAQAKQQKVEQKKAKKAKKAETEAAPSEAPEMTEITAPSEASAPAPASARRAPPSAAYSFTTGDDTNTVYSDNRTEGRTAPSEANESSYYSDYRPNADPSAFSNSRSRRDDRERRHRHSQSQSRSRHGSASPRKQHRSSRQSAAASDIFTTANGGVQGHMAYPCHIPGLSQAGSVGVSESVSQVGGPSHQARRGRGRDVMDGYRRGGVRPVGRRDSLSDSDS